MATTIATYHTLIEFGNRHKNKMLLDIVESTKANPLTQIMPWREANGLTQHTHARTVNYPEASPRFVGKGPTPSNAEVQPTDEPIRAFEKQFDLDELYEDLEKNFKQYRYDEEKKQYEGLSRTMMTQFFYGNPASTTGHLSGLATRYASIGTYAINEGGTGSDTSSVWMLKLGEDGVFLTYPQGSKSAGFTRKLGGRVRNSSYAWAWNTTLRINFGICVAKDPAVQRVANIDSGATLDPDNIITLATNVMEEYGSYDGVVLLMNARCWGMLWKEANSVPGLLVKALDPFGNEVWQFDGIPIYLCGGLTSTETAIS